LAEVEGWENFRSQWTNVISILEEGKKKVKAISPKLPDPEKITPILNDVKEAKNLITRLMTNLDKETFEHKKWYMDELRTNVIPTLNKEIDFWRYCYNRALRETRNFCPYCGKPISPTDKICPYCGKPTEVKKPPLFVPPSPSPSPRPALPTCPHCGKSLGPGDVNFCTSCGRRLTKEVETKEEKNLRLTWWDAVNDTKEQVKTVPNKWPLSENLYVKFLETFRRIKQDRDAFVDIVENTILVAPRDPTNFKKFCERWYSQGDLGRLNTHFKNLKKNLSDFDILFNQDIMLLKNMPHFDKLKILNNKFKETKDFLTIGRRGKELEESLHTIIKLYSKKRHPQNEYRV